MKKKIVALLIGIFILISVNVYADILEQRVSASSDDAEEKASGSISLGSSDLELVYDGSNQTVGMRFNLISIPQGATITNAYIQFKVKATSTVDTTLAVEGEAVDFASTFNGTAWNISSRLRTAAKVTWIPLPWTLVGEAEYAQRTPDIRSIIQEIVSRPGWISGNSLVIIITGNGKRVARSYNGDAAGAPLLHVEYTTEAVFNQPPVVNAGTGRFITLPNNMVTLQGSVIDDGLPSGSSVTTTWSHVGGTGAGTVTFGDVNAVDTTATFTPDPGTYILRLTADDTELINFDEMIVTVNKWAFISAGWHHTIALKTDGTLWAWGKNSYGQLGDGTRTSRFIPTQIGTDDTWVSIAAGGYHAVAMKADGTLWAWGRNNCGQLGDGTNTNQYSPVQIGSDNTWVSIAAGRFHNIALKADGTLWAWGYNYYGQLGDGTNTDKNIPIQIGSDDMWVSIAAGGYHTIAMKTDGTLWAWGRNNYRQLGVGSTLYSINTPIQIGSDNTWAAIDAGRYYSMALKADGTLWAWGQNDYGQLGDGTNTDKNIPIQIGSDNMWMSITAGWYYAMALKADGTLWAWGRNDYGQLGDGTNTDKNIPIQIGDDNTWISITAGGEHAIALKADGMLWAWGRNDYGQLGDGTNTDKNTPVPLLQ